MVDLKSFTQVPKFSGSDSEFKAFEFKLQHFVRGQADFEKYLDWIKELESEPKEKDISDKDDD